MASRDVIATVEDCEEVDLPHVGDAVQGATTQSKEIGKTWRHDRSDGTSAVLATRTHRCAARRCERISTWGRTYDRLMTDILSTRRTRVKIARARDGTSADEQPRVRREREESRLTAVHTAGAGLSRTHRRSRERLSNSIWRCARPTFALASANGAMLLRRVGEQVRPPTDAFGARRMPRPTRSNRSDLSAPMRWATEMVRASTGRGEQEFKRARELAEQRRCYDL